MMAYMTKKEETITRLAQLLKAADVDRDTALTVSLRLRKPGKAEQMIEWLEQNKVVTPEEICAKSREIAKSINDPENLIEFTMA